MAAPRPTECPVCGHDRPKRGNRASYLLSSPERGQGESWLCGLCRYEWVVTVTDPVQLSGGLLS